MFDHILFQALFMHEVSPIRRMVSPFLDGRMNGNVRSPSDGVETYAAGVAFPEIVLHDEDKLREEMIP